jgi:hypothetical protein
LRPLVRPRPVRPALDDERVLRPLPRDERVDERLDDERPEPEIERPLDIFSSSSSMFMVRDLLRLPCFPLGMRTS